MKVVIFLLVAFSVSLLITWPEMALANYVFSPRLLTEIFGVPHMTFWRMYALDLLLGLVFIDYRTHSKRN